MEPSDHIGEDRSTPDHDLAFAEALESASVQNAVVAGGPGALAMVPVARVLTRVAALTRRLLRRRPR